MDTEKVLLDINEAIALYGGSEGWWRKAVLMKQVPYCKRGDRVCFLRSDLNAYFVARRVPVLDRIPAGGPSGLSVEGRA